MKLEDIAPEPGQRGLIIGGSRSGKSTLLDHLVRHAAQTRPGVEIALADTKPRFRADVRRIGPLGKMQVSAQKKYEMWAKGPTVPGSVLVDLEHDKPLKHIWRKDDPYRIAILQTDVETERRRILEVLNDWYCTHKGNTDRIIAADEVLDFYKRNSWSIAPDKDVLLKATRAGGERGFSTLFGAQRPKGIPPQFAEELSVLYLFHLRYYEDIKYLWDMGVPRNLRPPEEDYAFHVLRIKPGGKVSEPLTCRLTLTDAYASQLSGT